MRLTARGRYAVTAMLDLVMNHESRPVSLADISQRQQISLSYLEQLFARLRRSGLVNSVRGPGGGYLPAMPADDISVASIIDAVDESMDSTRCGGLSDCQQGDTCLTHHLWSELSDEIHTYLTGVTLGSLARREEIQQIALRQHRNMDDKRIPAASP